jgi:DNA-binding NarL/FixJ family response regulator
MGGSVAVWSPDPLTVEGVTTILRSTPEIRVVPVEELATVDVLIIAGPMLDKPVLELIARLFASSSARIILLAEELTDAQLRALAGHPVSAVRSRSSITDDELVQLVRAVISSAKMPPLDKQLERGDTGALHPVGTPQDLLSPRERALLTLLADGYDTREIAQKMAYSERAVKYIVSGILRRLGSKNRPHAVAVATRLGLIWPEPRG